jgi:hypothetical protein
MVHFCEARTERDSGFSDPLSPSAANVSELLFGGFTSASSVMRKSPRRLLFIEPRQPASPTPVIDQITRRMSAAFRQATNSEYACGGYHRCICGVLSEDHDFYLPNGDLTNSLCVHYVAYHRAEVPQQALARIDSFTFGELEPTQGELQAPREIFEKSRELPEYPVEARQALTELDARIEALDQEKHAAVAEGHFEQAAHLRNQADQLKKEKQNIVREWHAKKDDAPNRGSA